MYYSKLKILHYPEKLKSFVDGTITPPIHIRIKPTNVCNHNCSYCSYQNSYGQLGKDMNVQDHIPIDKLLEIVEDCSSMGVKAITFSGGGEPLLYKDFMRVLHRCDTGGIATAILTNGVLLKDAMLQVALECCSWIRISMDGWDPKSYAEYRSCPEGDFDQLMTNLERAAGYKSKTPCVLGVNIVVDAKNATHLSDMVKMVHDRGIKSIKVSPCIVSNDGKENNNLHFAIRPLIQKEFKKIERAGIEIYNSYHQQLEGFEKDYIWCPYIQILPIIGADQNVYACHDKAYNNDGKIGSIKDVSFRHFWYNSQTKFYRINPSKDCNHHCMTDGTNRMIFEFLQAEHKEFV